MAAIIIDGKVSAASCREKAAKKAESLKKSGIMPQLAVVLVGNDPASQVYVRNKERACTAVGILSSVFRLPESITQAELEKTIKDLNEDGSIHGILVQLPLPNHLNEKRILSLIKPEKDVDGFHPINAGRLLLGDEGFTPCTPLGVMQLLSDYRIDPVGKRAVIIGRSNIVGKPLALLLLSANATVTVCHSKTKHLNEVCGEADILISAVGKAGFVTPDMVKKGAVVIDVGINRIDGHIVGDVSPEVSDVASYLTPVPGGVGPMTIAMLLNNTLRAAERCRELH